MMITREEYISSKGKSTVTFSQISKDEPRTGDSESGLDELSALMHIRCIKCSKAVLQDEFFCPFCGSVNLQNMLIKGKYHFLNEKSQSVLPSGGFLI